MVSTRRNGARSIQTPATTSSSTPSTTVSPLLSSHNSVVPETPDTSDVDQHPKAMKAATKLLATSRVNIRKRLLSDDAQEHQDSGGRQLATKRRIIHKAVFVEIPIRSATPNSKARIASLLSPSMLSAINIQQATPLTGKERVSAPSKANDEYDEHLGESEASDSEYEQSDSDFPLASKIKQLSDVDDSEGDEDMMVAAAIELSRETARLAAQEHLGVGSSSRTIAPPNPKITKKAAAAERRLRKTGSKAKGKGKGKARASPSSDDDFILAESESELSALTSSENETQPSNGKGKTTKKDKAKYIVTEPMTWVERAERRREQAAARRLTRQEEMALRQELGRRLTWVNDFSLLEHYSNGQHRPRKPLWH
jgi:DNA repair protein RAD16